MSAARWLSFYWSPEHQEIACDGERFAHPVATNTAASHDVAHLLAAASGLPWRPRGIRDDVCASEFNAVLLEHLGVNVLEAMLLGRGKIETVLPRTLEYARFFVGEHYAPFPVLLDEAIARFVDGADISCIARLSPVFFRARLFELENENYRMRTLAAEFSSDFVAPCEPLLAPIRETFAGALASLCEARPST